MDTETINLVKKALPNYKGRQIDATLDLLNDNNTVPFIARYRKEMTGNLDEVEIREIQDEANRISKLQQRKHEVIKQITEQGKITTQLTQQINQASQLQQVEDIYLPFQTETSNKGNYC